MSQHKCSLTYTVVVDVVVVVVVVVAVGRRCSQAFYWFVEFVIFVFRKSFDSQPHNTLILHKPSNNSSDFTKEKYSCFSKFNERVAACRKR